MGGFLWGLAIVLLVVWVLVKLILGIAGALFHLLLVIAVLVILYNLIRAGASRRVRRPASKSRAHGGSSRALRSGEGQAALLPTSTR